MKGITISITIPDNLENLFSKKAKEMEISRSRFISNILLNWQQDQKNHLYNKCMHNSNGFCRNFGLSCLATEQFAKGCPEYEEFGGE